LARYIVKPHFSLESMEYVPQTGKVLYHGTMNKGKRRNFEIFEANDFLASEGLWVMLLQHLDKSVGDFTTA
jgi:hypothetical protein